MNTRELIDSADRTAVAIVGIGCRFPGAVSSATELWDLLRDARNVITDVPADRFDTRRLYDARPATPGRIMTRRGGFVANIDMFDAAHFGMSPREAARLDPQQRLLLETSCEALDDAGLDRRALEGSRTGVFIGQWLSDYEARLFANLDFADFYMTTGSGRYASAGRLSFFLGLRGPSLSLDTACSSSLAAVHLAVRSLRNGESMLALAGGVNVILQPHITIAYSQSRMMAPDGQCKFGDARGDGYVRSEGAGMVVLKSLDRALADRDRIYAVIRGSALNHDGSSSGSMGRPSRIGQVELLQQAYLDAAVDPATVQLVEAHGTGTRAGDPVEVDALSAVLSTGRKPRDRAWIGSIKTNIGHTEGAAGVAGLIKAALALHHGEIPASLHFEQPNPAIDWVSAPLHVPTTLLPWPRGTQVRRAGVTAFGIGGTNAHVVLEEAPSPSHQEMHAGGPGCHTLLLSAATPQALVQVAKNMSRLLEEAAATPGDLLARICYTAALRRTQHEHRLAVVARNGDEMRDRVAAFANGRADEHCVVGRATAGAAGRLAFIFPGQGTQWIGMARDLLHSSPAFRDATIRCDALVRAETGWSVIAELEATEEESRLDDISVVQPVLFAIQVALTEMWRAHGVTPDAVVGHSMGEVAASWACGALPLGDAVRVICRRSAMMREVRGQGAMALVELSSAEAEAAVHPFGTLLCVAVSNSARSTVVAGEPAALDAFLEGLESRAIFHRKINVDVASHSPQMDRFVEPLTASLAGLVAGPASLPFYSTVDARVLRGPELEPAYWGRNLRQPVQFASAVRLLAADGFTSFVELSPHPALLGSVQQELKAADVDTQLIPTLFRDTPGAAAFALALARLHVAGRVVRWDACFPQETQPITLPHYPWQRERHWYEPPAASGSQGSGGLITNIVRSSLDPDVAMAELQVDLQRLPYLEDHRVRGSIVAPAALFIELALELALELAAPLGDGGNVVVEDLRLDEALIIGPLSELRVQVASGTGALGSRTLCISSTSASAGAGGWTLHAQATSRLVPFVDARVEIPPEYRLRRGADAHYAALAARGLEYGPAFRGVVAAFRDGEAGWARIELPARLVTTGHIAHPVLLDGALQLAVSMVEAPGVRATYVPVACGQIEFRPGAAPSAGWARGILRPPEEAGDGGTIVDLDLYDDDGCLLFTMHGVVLKRVGAATDGDALLSVDWHIRDVPAGIGRVIAASAKRERTWSVTGPDPASAKAIAVALAARGALLVNAVPVDTAASPREEAVDVIVHAAAFPPAVPVAEDRPLLEDSLAACGALLSSAQAAIDRRTRAPTQFVAVTWGAQAILPDDLPDVAQAPAWGLMRTLATEHAELGSRVVDMPGTPTSADLDALAAELLERADDQVGIRDGRAWRPALAPPSAMAPRVAAPKRRPRSSAPYRAATTTPGILDGVGFRQARRRQPGAGQIEIEIDATGLNFMNVLSALGNCPGYPKGIGPLGLECAGRVGAVGKDVSGFVPGDRVLAIALDSLASHATTDARLARRIPDGLDVAQAAAVPIAYTTAHYALVVLGRLRRGERVLIHSAAGGVGLAAIAVARHVGAEIYATAGNDEKRRLLASMGVKQVMDSHSLSFRDELLAATNGEGVDVVLNSLAGEFIGAGLDVLRPYGRFLEIGKRDIYGNTRVGLLPFQRNLSYHAIDLDRMIRERPDLVGELLGEVVGKLATGGYRALPVSVSPLSRTVEAFREMARGTHVGKLVLMHGEAEILVDEHEQVLESLTSGACVITGGLGGLGLALAERLVERGARRLALAARSPATPTQLEALDRLRERGATVVVLQADVADAVQASRALDDAEAALGPIHAVVHAAGILDDALFRNQDENHLRRVFAPKLGGAWNLHRALARRPDATLVLYSSIVALLGLAGQANYAAANAGLDALATLRRASGSSALSINWGPWSGVGLAAARDDRGARLAGRGLANLEPAEALDLLERALPLSRAQIAITHLDAPAYVDAHPAAIRSVLLAGLLDSSAVSASAEPPQETLRQRLLEANTDRAREELLRSFVTEQVGKVLRQPTSRLDADRPFRALGLDSLMGLELRNRIESEAALTMPATVVWNYPTIAGLADELGKRLGLALAGHASAPSDMAPSAGAQSDGELEAILAEVERLSPEQVRGLLGGVE